MDAFVRSRPNPRIPESDRIAYDARDAVPADRAGMYAMRLTSATAPRMVTRRASVGIATVVATPRPSATRPHTNSADDQAGGNSDDEPDGRERWSPATRWSPRTCGAVEAERLEHGEVVSSATYPRDERVADGEEREAGEQRGEGHGEPVDVAEAVDFDRHGTSGWVGPTPERRDAMLNRGLVASGCEAARGEIGWTSCWNRRRGRVRRR